MCSVSDALAAEVRRRLAAGELASVSSLARRAGLSQPFLSNWLAGRRRLGVESLDGVRAVLRVSLCEMADCAECPLRRVVEVPAPRKRERRAPWRRRIDPIVALSLAA